MLRQFELSINNQRIGQQGRNLLTLHLPRNCNIDPCRLQNPRTIHTELMLIGADQSVVQYIVARQVRGQDGLVIG